MAILVFLGMLVIGMCWPLALVGFILSCIFVVLAKRVCRICGTCTTYTTCCGVSFRKDANAKNGATPGSEDVEAAAAAAGFTNQPKGECGMEMPARVVVK